MNADADKLILLVDCLPMLPGGDNGGAKWAAIGIIESLIKVQPNWRIIVMCRALVHDELRAALPQAEIIVGLDSSGMHIADLRLPRLRDGNRIDAILCPFVGPQIVHPDIPIASVIYDVQYRYYPGFFSVDDLQARARSVVDALGQSDRIICGSEATRNSFIEFYPYPPEQISTIPLRLADRLSHAAGDQQHLARFGLTPQKYLLYPANAWLHKNHAMLLVAYALYCRKLGSDSLTLVCTGADTGREAETLKIAIESMGLTGKVLLLGFLEEATLAALLTNAYAMLFPSMFEGFGMPVLEAMQRGTPVLCSDLPPLRELAGDAALYFDHRKPDDIAAAIHRLQHEPDLRERMVELSRNQAQPYTDRNAMGVAFADVIKSIVEVRKITKPATTPSLYQFGQRISPEVPIALENMLGDGWSSPELDGIWCTGERSTLFLSTVTVCSTIRLALEVSAFIVPQLPNQRLGIFINGQNVGHWQISGPQTIYAEVPETAWNAGRPIEITLLHPDYQSPSALGLSPDERGLSIFLRSFTASLVE